MASAGHPYRVWARLKCNEPFVVNYSSLTIWVVDIEISTSRSESVLVMTGSKFEL